jgi:hypothetical protein
MGADVGQAAQGARSVARQQQGFVDAARQQLARRQAQRLCDIVEVAYPLPAAFEDTLLRQLHDAGVEIEALVEDRGLGDVRVDREPCHGCTSGVTSRDDAARSDTPGLKRHGR